MDKRFKYSSLLHLFSDIGPPSALCGEGRTPFGFNGEAMVCPREVEQAVLTEKRGSKLLFSKQAARLEDSSRRSLCRGIGREEILKNLSLMANECLAEQKLFCCQDKPPPTR